MYINSAFMELTISLTELLSSSKDEVPVGSLIVFEDKIICYSLNEVESKRCSIMHAELLSIIRASEILEQKYLEDCHMYVTLEPCHMCMSAIVKSRISRLYFSAYRNANCAESTVFNSCKTEIYGGIIANRSEKLIKDFFKQKRKRSKNEFY